MTAQRSRLIKQLLPFPYTSKIIKYDYYFTNNLISKIPMVDPIISISAFDKYYVVILEEKVIISDYKIHKVFTLPEYITLYDFCVLLSGDKFLFMTYEPDLYTIDFTTQETQEIKLPGLHNHISDLKTFKNQIIILTYEEIFVINSQNFEVENIIHTTAVRGGLIVLEDQFLTVNQQNTAVDFWDGLHSKPIKSIPIEDTTLNEPVFIVRQMKNHLILAYDSGRIVIMNLQSQNIVVNINKYKIKDILVRDNDFIVLFERGRIRIFDIKSGVKKKQIYERYTQHIFLLPNNQVLIAGDYDSEGFIKIYDIELNKIQEFEYEENEGRISGQNYIIDVSDKVILGTEDGDILVFE